MQIRLDKVILASFIDTFLNYDTDQSTITISGGVANGATATFQTSITIDRTNTLADVYATNRNTGKKMNLLAGSVHSPYQYISSETIDHRITLSGNTLTVAIDVTNNTGAGITLTTQVWDITAVLQLVPY